jgi:hypothetical protein
MSDDPCKKCQKDYTLKYLGIKPASCSGGDGEAVMEGIGKAFLGVIGIGGFFNDDGPTSNADQIQKASDGLKGVLEKCKTECARQILDQKFKSTQEMIEEASAKIDLRSTLTENKLVKDEFLIYNSYIILFMVIIYILSE